jgi:hypothetical protein
MTRSLKIVLVNGLTEHFLLPDTSSTEATSAGEIIGVIEKYSKGIQRMRERNPLLVVGKPTIYTNVDEALHTLINARKYIDMPVIALLGLVDQSFTLDLQKNIIVFYDKKGEERGSMFLDGMYSNWREILYPETIVTEADIITVHEEEEEDISTEVPFDMLKEDMVKDLEEPMGEDDEEFEDEESDDEEYVDETVTPVRIVKEMKEKLESCEGESACNLWEYLFVDHDLFGKTVVIDYSGGGDSGQTDNVAIYDTIKYKAAKSYEETMACDESDSYPTLISGSQLDNLTWSLISSRVGGFYNDEGGYGKIILTGKSFQWDHFNYIQHEEHEVCTSVTAKEEKVDADSDTLPF